MNEEDDRQIERMLLRYRPPAPPAALKARVLRACRQRRRWPAALGWAAAAAVVIVGLALWAATDRVVAETAAMVAVPAPWTADAELAARMLDGDGSGRRYVAVALAASGGRVAPPSPDQWRLLLGDSQ